jgi:hypothetical protein
VKENAAKVFFGEHELALAMTRHVLELIGAGRSDTRVTAS